VSEFETAGFSGAGSLRHSIDATYTIGGGRTNLASWGDTQAAADILRFARELLAKGLAVPDMFGKVRGKRNIIVQANVSIWNVI